ncbi:MAG TPA: hypothetical protein VJZ00_23185, partial [Thermoanaerobaculia bacterium]|nr:hypothetical protein [Thermoanaerobaculia bacterium]
MSPRDSYATTLEVLRKKRQQLQDELAELEPLISGLERLAQREASPRPGKDGEPVHMEPMAPHPMPGLYSEMEFVPAAEDYLRRSGIPQTTQEIADALVAQGFRTRSKDFKNTAQALLKRAMD